MHTVEPAAAVISLGSDAKLGLTEAEAARRLAEHGPNALVERGGRGPARILWEQVTAVMVLILLAAAGLSAGLGKWTEAVSILAIVVLFVALGFLQEYRAERAMAALKKLAVPTARVVRGGTVHEVSAQALVVGDIIRLEAGYLVPADARLIEVAGLRVQEAALTGESEPVEKSVAALEQPGLPLGDRVNQVYTGTVVTYGRGTAVVTATGMRTELGRIAGLMQDVQPELTPLQHKLDQVGKRLAVAGLIVAALVLVIGVLRGEPASDMLVTAISVAVAVVPEGLPAVVTFTLALGAQRMLRRNALIRKLPAVETLGAVTTICSDKTGTLTENRMTVTVVDLAGHRIELVEQVAHRHPALDGSVPPLQLKGPAAEPLRLLLTAGAACNDATLKPGSQPGRWHTLGDPTEGALLLAAVQGGLDVEATLAHLPRVAELPFDSERKRMTTAHRAAGASLPLAAEYVAFTKGAVDGLVPLASRVWVNDRTEPLNTGWRARILAAQEQMAQNGQRVLGLAFRPVPAGLADNGSLAELEQDLIFIGLVGMIDPPRAEVRQAVQVAQAAGIRPVMITGDHPLTATAIAQDLGLAPGNGISPGINGANGHGARPTAARDQVLTGQELDDLDDTALAQVVEQVPVFARVSPEHKLRIVRALQQRGHIVAMTGDGVNDAPALKQADIGVAMGITGTDVSKEAADMVLRDDNFATIVAAVEEGRVIFDNVRRFVKFSIAGNIGKVGVMLAAPLVGINVALLPLQLLWLNLMTDGLLGLGLGVEKAERDTMRRPPHSPQAGIFSGGLAIHAGWVGLLIGALALGIGLAYWRQGHAGWQTMLFNTLAFLQIGQALATRSMRNSLARIGLGSNRLLLGMVLLVAALQAAVVYTPGLERFFGVTALPAADFALSVALGAVPLAAIELEKWLLSKRQR